jgi:hypothetical protein
MRNSTYAVVLATVACLALANVGTAAQPKFAVWLDGNTSAGGGGNGILTSLDHAFGTGSYTLVTTAQLETAGFLASYQALIVSRSGSSFGGALSAGARTNVAAWVGSGASQGGVALFTNDLADNLFGATSGDPFDANLDRLFVNAATYAAATGHGYIGEFNGSFEAIAMGLLPGSANAVHGTSGSGGVFIYNVGPIGATNAIDAGVTFPFTDLDHTLYRTDITGAAADNIVDVYADNSLPAVLANSAVIKGGLAGAVTAASVPTLSTWGLALLAMLLAGSAYWMTRKTRTDVH